MPMAKAAIAGALRPWVSIASMTGRSCCEASTRAASASSIALWSTLWGRHVIPHAIAGAPGGHPMEIHDGRGLAASNLHVSVEVPAPDRGVDVAETPLVFGFPRGCD